MTRRSISTVALAALVAAGATAGAAGAGSKAKTHKATIGSGYYAPAKLSLKAGDKVRWTWDSSLFDPHDVTVDKGPQKFSSPVQSSGTYTRTFKKAGTYVLVCTQHPDMTMTVKVKKAARR